MHDIALIVGSLRKDSWTRKIGLALRDLGAAVKRKTEEVPIGRAPR